MKTIILLILLSIGATSVFGSRTIYPDNTPPNSPATFYSPDSTYWVVLNHGVAWRTPPVPCTLELLTETSIGSSEVWNTILPHKTSPYHVFVSEDGRYVVVLGDYVLPKLEQAAPIIIYDIKNRKEHQLTELVTGNLSRFRLSSKAPRRASSAPEHYSAWWYSASISNTRLILGAKNVVDTNVWTEPTERLEIELDTGIPVDFTPTPPIDRDRTEFLWDRLVADQDYPMHMYRIAVSLDPEDGCYVANPSKNGLLVSRVDTSGNTAWTRTIQQFFYAENSLGQVDWSQRCEMPYVRNLELSSLRNGGVAIIAQSNRTLDSTGNTTAFSRLVTLDRDGFATSFCDWEHDRAAEVVGLYEEDGQNTVFFTGSTLWTYTEDDSVPRVLYSDTIQATLYAGSYAKFFGLPNGNCLLASSADKGVWEIDYARGVVDTVLKPRSGFRIVYPIVQGNSFEILWAEEGHDSTLFVKIKRDGSRGLSKKIAIETIGHVVDIVPNVNGGYWAIGTVRSKVGDFDCVAIEMDSELSILRTCICGTEGNDEPIAIQSMSSGPLLAYQNDLGVSLVKFAP